MATVSSDPVTLRRVSSLVTVDDAAFFLFLFLFFLEEAETVVGAGEAGGAAMFSVRT